jgi:hypothetical protein
VLEGNYMIETFMIMMTTTNTENELVWYLNSVKSEHGFVVIYTRSIQRKGQAVA